MSIKEAPIPLLLSAALHPVKLERYRSDQRGRVGKI
jgi:hypothetical protein